MIGKMSAVKTSKRGKHRAPATAPANRARKIAIDFPASLFRETEQAVHELSINRSVLIRSAVEMFLRIKRREKLERQIAESFSANAGLDRQLVTDFAHVDADIDAR
jgi:metal-responsive CopG/Arc/MetJ family transcriptional regulator